MLPRTARRSTRPGTGSQSPHRAPHLLAALLLLLAAPRAFAQAMPTATRAGDLQFGGGLTFGTSTYNFDTAQLLGGTAYAAFDVRKHWGAEFDFHQLKPSDDSTVYERTFEIGPRYHINAGPFAPYAKAMVGRGIYNFHNSNANIAYNIFTAGAGIDYHLFRSWNLRAGYEYQTWPNFPLNTLHPSIVTIGFAYHVHE